ncbi:dihydrolipoamide acetyltransferase family protein [Leifsonia sp. Root112D2]|uniref:dihydrolipoamide acetyltransferase family protein n=1 Tax=Leifsonia sp. Root112D2 TaxID=1736426 RepID=UPI0006FC9ABC|nr:dihydrolipoamide acetyltransferase family protein [Leifsonia sp. Root112D2]KQV05287.1 hypothetical protein ASC63_15110 [Leifsonia sp. Root112D2]
MTVKDFMLPDLGEGLTESELVSWNVKVGDTVELNQIIADVETAKALVELPSPYAGVVTRLYVEPGVTVNVGEKIVAFEVDGEPLSPIPESPLPEEAARGRLEGPADPSTTIEDPILPNLVGYGAKAETGARPARRVRNLPTGEAASALPEHPSEGETRIPIKGVRKRTAEAMVASAFTAPHASAFMTVDVTPTLELLERLTRSGELAGARVTILTAVAKALCIAVGRTPEVNSHWDEAAQQIVQFHAVNLGIAAATPRGLMVPNIPRAETLTLAQLAAAVSGLVATAKEGRSSPEELSGGTISISNVGVFGVDGGTPILNPGEAAILAMGTIRRQPWEFEGGIALRSVMTLTLSFDHRLVDGEQASRFLADVGRILADPARVLAMV